MCKISIKNPPPGTDVIIFLEVLCEVIKNSGKSCQITHSFIDLFDFIKEVSINYRNAGSNFELFLLRLTNMLCLQLAVEFRFKVCEFMEDFFECVINFHGKNNSHVNTLVYHFLMVTLCVHNPNGVPDSEKAAYAFNPQKWKTQFQKIFDFCQNQLRIILRTPRGPEIEIEFLELFVEVAHLVKICYFFQFKFNLK